MTPEELKAEAQASVIRALNHIQEAQRHLALAQSELSKLVGAIVVWRATDKLYTRVHTFWYRVEAFRKAGKFKLDDISVDALESRRSAR